MNIPHRMRLLPNSNLNLASKLQYSGVNWLGRPARGWVEVERAFDVKTPARTQSVY